MINLIENESVIINARHVNDYKPAGFEFLYVDDHNPRKAHHIIISSEGETHYNQAIDHGPWQDFYEWEYVAADYKHGYQKYIDQAVADLKRVQKAQRVEERACVALEVGEGFKMHVNQGWRDAEVVGVIGNEALVVYRMPRGRYSIRVLQHDVNLLDRRGNTIYLDGKEHSCVEGFRYRDIRGYPRSKIIQKWCKGNECEFIDDIIISDALDFS